MVLTRAPENVGGNHDISFEALFTLSVAGHIDMLFFQVFLFVISGFLLVGLMSFLAESLSNPVVIKVGGIAPLGAIGEGAKKTKGAKQHKRGRKCSITNRSLS